MTRRVLAIAAHADDETLGCGATLLKHGDQGDETSWLIVTAPWTPLFDDAFLERWESQIDAVSRTYGMARTFKLGLPATRLDTMPEGEVIEAIRKAVDEARPDIVYLVHPGDSHADHRIAFNAAMVALKPFASWRVVDIYCYETISSTNVAPPLPGLTFVPQCYSDVSNFIETKLEILDLYETEMKPPPHPRSIEAVRALARYRGGTILVDYAEAFAVIRTSW